MKQKDLLGEIVKAMNKTNGDVSAIFNGGIIPTMITSRSGVPVHFFGDAGKLVRELSQDMFLNRRPDLVKIELNEYQRQVFQAFADLYSENFYCDVVHDELENVLNRLKSQVEEEVKKVIKPITHYFPSHTLGVEGDSCFVLGPVTIYNRNAWIDTVDFPQRAKDEILQPANNELWRDNLRAALNGNGVGGGAEGIADIIFHPVKDCAAILKVVVTGYEINFSRKIAQIVAKSALDALSLVSIDPADFQRQVLQAERLQPRGVYSIVETDGYLHWPGSGLTKRVRPIDPARVLNFINGSAKYTESVAAALFGVMQDECAKNHQLCSRWATALDWHAEASREINDAIAVTKYGTCLDILAGGRLKQGIRELLVNLFGMELDDYLINGDQKSTLREVIDDVYSNGRSRILHGNHHDRLKSFEALRNIAWQVSRIALIESVIRLGVYSGCDEDIAFIKMPA